MENIIPFYDRETIDQEADIWLIKLDRDEPLTSKELAELQEWMARSPAHREELSRMAEVWGEMNILTQLSVPLGRTQKTRQSWYQSVFNWPSNILAQAASVVIVCGVLLTMLLLPTAIDQSNGQYATELGQQQSYLLADGSKIQLNTNSRLRVAFGEEHRDIYLQEGEVYFDVAKNKHKPFRVFAGNGRVQAIGTAFTVRLKEDRAVQVTVTEGRVGLAGMASTETSDQQALSASRTAQLGVLIAGQGATIKQEINIDSSKNAAVAKPVLADLEIYSTDDLSQRMAWRKGLLIFSGEPLEEVVAEISRYTDVVITIPEASVRAIKVGGQFEVGDTQMMLSALETTFALKILREDNDKITILSAVDQ